MSSKRRLPNLGFKIRFRPAIRSGDRRAALREIEPPPLRTHRRENPNLFCNAGAKERVQTAFRLPARAAMPKAPPAGSGSNSSRKIPLEMTSALAVSPRSLTRSRSSVLRNVGTRRDSAYCDIRDQSQPFLPAFLGDCPRVQHSVGRQNVRRFRASALPMRRHKSTDPTHRAGGSRRRCRPAVPALSSVQGQKPFLSGQRRKEIETNAGDAGNRAQIGFDVCLRVGEAIADKVDLAAGGGLRRRQRAATTGGPPVAGSSEGMTCDTLIRSLLNYPYACWTRDLRPAIP